MIQISIDPRAALGALTDAQDRQFPFAVSRALNRVANDAQKSMQAGLKERFHLRRTAWNLRGIKISKQDRSNKSTWRVVIQVSPETSYLDKFEKGGFKFPMGGHSYLWEPNAKVFKNKIIPAGDPLRPKNLHMHLDPGGRVIGDQRTFRVRPNNHGTTADFLILQRQSRSGPKRAKHGKHGKMLERKSSTVVLYKLRKRIPIQAQLEFVSTIQSSVDATFDMHMGQAMVEAMRSAK